MTFDGIPDRAVQKIGHLQCIQIYCISDPFDSECVAKNFTKNLCSLKNSQAFVFVICFAFSE